VKRKLMVLSSLPLLGNLENIDHGSPGGCGTAPRYFDGTPFLAAEAELKEIINRIIAWLKQHLSKL
jgi:hypothetical protein